MRSQQLRLPVAGSRGLDPNQCLDLRGPCVYTIALWMIWMAPALALQRVGGLFYDVFCHCFLFIIFYYPGEARKHTSGAFFLFLISAVLQRLADLHLSQRTQRPKESIPSGNLT